MSILDKIYYQDEWATIYCGDCNNILKNVSAIGLVVTSPPYFNEREYSQWASFADYECDMRNTMGLLFNSMRDYGTIIWNVSMLNTGRGEIIDLSAYSSQWLRESGFKFFKKIIWRKAGNQTRSLGLCIQNPYVSFYIPEQAYEELLVFTKGDLTGHRQRKTPIDINLAQKYSADVWNIPQVTHGSPQDLGHSAPFPELLVSNCINFFAESDDTILDPFSGSGTTCFVAKKLNRRSIGIEISEKYCEIAKKRLAQSVMRL